MIPLIIPSSPSAPSAGFVNAGTVIGNIWPPLNARGPADAVFWTQEQMLEWFNESAKRLSGAGNVFVVRDTSLTAVLDTATYDLPAQHQATIQADLAGQVLKPRTVQETEALDATWPVTTGDPEAFLLDVEGVKKLTLYPIPNAAAQGKTIGLVMRELPDEVTDFLAAPSFLAEYFTFSLLAEARSPVVETRAQMPEISAWCKQQADMMLQAIQSYTGGA